MIYYKNLSLQSIGEEVWGYVPFNELGYSVSNLGRMVALQKTNAKNQLLKPKIMKQHLNGGGYLFVNLWNNRKSKSHLVHVMVAKRFVPNPCKKPFVNHKNGIKTDNKAINLEWVTKSENAIHSYRILGQINGMKGKFWHLRKDSQSVTQFSINGNEINRYKSVTIASVFTGVAASNINKCIKNERMSAGGFIWKVNKKT